jgi:hypothetical protein
MNLSLAIQKAGQLNSHFLPNDAHGLRWLYSTCGQWSDPSIKEVSQRVIAPGVFAFVTIPMAFGYSGYFCARGFFQTGNYVLNGRMKEAITIFRKDGAAAFKCLVLTVTNIAYALLGLILGHSIYKTFIPPPCENRDLCELTESWNDLRIKVDITKKELDRLNEKIDALNKEHSNLESLCRDEKQWINKYQKEIEEQKKITETYHMQIRELELTLSSLNAATALKKEIAEKNLELEDKTKEIQEKQKAIEEQRTLFEKLKIAHDLFENSNKQLLADQHKLNQKISFLEEENILLKNTEQLLHSSLNEKKMEISKLSDKLEDMSYFEAKDIDSSEDLPASSSIDTEQEQDISTTYPLQNSWLATGSKYLADSLSYMY